MSPRTETKTCVLESLRRRLIPFWGSRQLLEEESKITGIKQGFLLLWASEVISRLSCRKRLIWPAFSSFVFPGLKANSLSSILLLYPKPAIKLFSANKQPGAWATEAAAGEQQRHLPLAAPSQGQQGPLRLQVRSHLRLDREETVSSSRVFTAIMKTNEY